jgi:DNA (cytosine-5)-methyltransferase 1
MGLTFIDFFSGIGGFRLGMEMAGHECVGHCEIDKFANASYKAMHRPKEDEWYANDITRVNPGELPEADCYCGGFPCQAFSIAGKRGGFADTRGTLFFEVMRLARERKPKYLLLENVAGLLSHDGGKTFGTILNTLGELGYWYEYQVLNSKHFGVPQNRERVFIIGHLRGTSGRKVFPIKGTNGKALKKLIDKGSQGYQVYDPNGVSCTLTSQTGGLGGKTGMYMMPKHIPTPDDINRTLRVGGGGSLDAKHLCDIVAIIGKDGKEKKKDHASCLTGGGHSGGNHSDMDLLVQPVLTPDRLEKRQNGRRMKEDGEPMFTLTAQDRHGIMLTRHEIKSKTDISHCLMARDYKEIGNQEMSAVMDGVKIRRLTPKECFRLQGFPDEYFERARAVNSDSQLYKQAGNSVTVNVIYEIARRLGRR